jgi:hypothetical protein
LPGTREPTGEFGLLVADHRLAERSADTAFCHLRRYPPFFPRKTPDSNPHFNPINIGSEHFRVIFFPGKLKN